MIEWSTNYIKQQFIKRKNRVIILIKNILTSYNKKHLNNKVKLFYIKCSNFEMNANHF